MVFYETKSHRAGKHRKPLSRGLEFLGWNFWYNLCTLWKYSDVILSTLKDPVTPFSCIWSSMKQKVIGLGNIEGPYPGTWIFQDRVFVTSTPPVKYKDVILSSLDDPVPPIFMYLVDLLWSKKSSGSETSEAPTQGPHKFRVESLGQSTPLWKNIVMLSCLVWKIRSPHFHAYGLLWSEKSSVKI